MNVRDCPLRGCRNGWAIPPSIVPRLPLDGCGPRHESLSLDAGRKPGAKGVVAKTHQQLALDLGSVREVISRYLAEWERMGWVRASRGMIEVRDRAALAGYGGDDAR